MAEDLMVKTFPLRMSNDLNYKLKVVTTRKEVTLHAWIMEAIAEKLSKEEQTA